MGQILLCTMHNAHNSARNARIFKIMVSIPYNLSFSDQNMSKALIGLPFLNTLHNPIKQGLAWSMRTAEQTCSLMLSSYHPHPDAWCLVPGDVEDSSSFVTSQGRGFHYFCSSLPNKLLLFFWCGNIAPGRQPRGSSPATNCLITTTFPWRHAVYNFPTVLIIQTHGELCTMPRSFVFLKVRILS